MYRLITLLFLLNQLIGIGATYVAQQYNPVQKYGTKATILAPPANLTCSTDQALCYPVPIQSVESQLTWLYAALDPKTNDLDVKGRNITLYRDSLVLLRGVKQAAGPRSMENCDPYACVAIRVKQSLPETRTSGILSWHDELFVTEARDRIRTMLQYVRYAGYAAASWCESVESDFEKKTDDLLRWIASQKGKFHGLSVHYWLPKGGFVC
jgi:hypothetical protein